MIQFEQIISSLTNEEITRQILAQLPESIAETYLTGAAIDSRQVIPGALFVAMGGERTDGHQFIANAFNSGAHLALIEKEIPDFPILDLRTGSWNQTTIHASLPFCLRVDRSLHALQKIAANWRDVLRLRTIGITGSVGKSSTKELIAGVLSQKFLVLKNHGNLNNEIGLPLTLMQAGLGHQRAVLEMGFYVPGEIRQLCEIARPSVGVVTNIGTVHAERAGSREIIARGKAELIESLPPDGVAILNIDDPLVKEMARLSKARVIYYGTDPAAELRATAVEGLGLSGLRMELQYNSESHRMEIPILGRHSVHTVLRAAAVALAEGLTWQEIEQGLLQSQSQLRMATTRAFNGALILDDSYNAAPESTMAALDLLAEVHPGTHRHIAVLGEMYELGQYEYQGHQQVGIRAAQTCQVLIAVGDRSKIIAEAAVQSGMKPQAIHWMATVQEAIEFLKSSLQETDVILIKGSHGLRMDRITWALETTL
ncbi:MAG: UDP-N-acetylmuramoyl-tripeptide--D-alanyl-D-alanine ligase [Anaerolineae bacterium]|nr:UDP-N-acetylmuramoyl-tripeptide--D-alanyl-D-alanine ligase [Anaerolineae bacterium]